MANVNGYTIEGVYFFLQVNERSNKEFHPVETLDLRDMESHEFEIHGVASVFKQSKYEYTKKYQQTNCWCFCFGKPR